MRCLSLFFLIAAAAAAQIVSAGLKAGVPATEAVSGFYSSPTNIIDTGRWTIGPTIEFHLPLGFSLEADALYRGYRTQFASASNEFVVNFPDSANPVTFPATFTAVRSNNKVWDFPLLVKYRIGPRRLRPFVDAGYTFSHRSTDSNVFFQCLSSAAVCGTSNVAFFLGFGSNRFSDTTGGPTGGVGVEYKRGRVRFAPEVRYTHLSNPTANLLTVLVGVTFE